MLHLLTFAVALPANGFRNNVSTILANVVNTFSRAGRLPGSLWISDDKQWQ
jgi:N,N-dimethylformamidase